MKRKRICLLSWIGLVGLITNGWLGRNLFCSSFFGGVVGAVVDGIFRLKLPGTGKLIVTGFLFMVGAVVSSQV